MFSRSFFPPFFLPLLIYAITVPPQYPLEHFLGKNTELFARDVCVFFFCWECLCVFFFFFFFFFAGDVCVCSFFLLGMFVCIFFLAGDVCVCFFFFLLNTSTANNYK